MAKNDNISYYRTIKDLEEFMKLWGTSGPPLVFMLDGNSNLIPLVVYETIVKSDIPLITIEVKQEIYFTEVDVKRVTKFDKLYEDVRDKVPLYSKSADSVDPDTIIIRTMDPSNITFTGVILLLDSNNIFSEKKSK